MARQSDSGVTIGFGLLNFLYVGLALVGLIRFRREPRQDPGTNSGAVPAMIFLVAFLLLRTALVTQLPTVEPRYVIPCFPRSPGHRSSGVGAKGT